MPAVARCLLIALNVLLLASPSFLERAMPSPRAYLTATLLLTLVNILLVGFWDRLAPRDEAGGGIIRIVPAAIAGSLACVVVGAAAHEWLREILIHPHDAQRADMLVVIQLAIRRMLQGGNPYSMYRLPWEITLPYGPMMWSPLVLPQLLHADVRFVTLLGFLFVPAACGIAATIDAAHGKTARAAGWLLLAIVLAISPDVRNFVAVGHTPVYWPLLALMAWLVARERWYGAAVAVGLLIVARTTMVSIAPVLLIAVWFRARPRVAGVAALLAAATLLPFLPFAVWDARALQYALYGSYQNIMKTFVWVQTDWVQHTIGTTALLLSGGWPRLVEPFQAAVLLAVYGAAAVAIGRGRRPLPWMAFALFVFSMTTLWPVIYLYFDVCLLLICAALSEAGWTRGVAKAWWGTLAVATAILAATAWISVPVNASIDAGSDAAREYLYAGFSGDEREGDTTFAWVNGTRAEILVPRRSRSDATIHLVCQPHLAAAGAVQQLSASLNGTVIGTVMLTDGWQDVALAAPGRAWQIGVNELTLFLSTAVSPKEAGDGDDARKLSVKIDRLTVRTP